MKQYDKIYLPERQEGLRAFRDNQGDVPVVHHGSVIVLTIEELRECFNWGMSSFEDTQTSYMSFEDFLRHKGIILP